MSKVKTKNFKLKVWRQSGPNVKGEFKTYAMDNVPEDMSLLEMLDEVNEGLIKKGEMPIEFDNDCREGICGACSCAVNGQPHGPQRATTTCQVYMRVFEEGETITLEPWRAKAFPIIRDLVVDRSAFDRIIAAGGFTGAKTGPHADANAMLIPKETADGAMQSASCIGCGACVAACPNASASLFTAAKISQMALLPQGHPMRVERVKKMVEQMDKEGFGGCTNIGECEAACPAEISISNIAKMRREYAHAMVAMPEVPSLAKGDAG